MARLQSIITILLTITFDIFGVHSDGYHYETPDIPFQFDEQQPVYLPPQFVLPPINNEIQPPSEDGISLQPPSNQYLPPKSVQVKITNMSCIDPKNGQGFFRATFQTSAQKSPVIESAAGTNCPITSLPGNVFQINFDGGKMAECGIKNCGTNMCVVMRMASVEGLRLADDPLMALQCIPQDPIVSHTKHLKFNTNSLQGRDGARNVAIAAGGNQKNFDTHISLLKKNSINGNFDQPLKSNVVYLGDELMLRAVVNDADGWKYSRMGAVTVKSLVTQKSALLVDENGCRVPAMKIICPESPRQISPLTIHLPFKAFLFQNSAPADDLILSVRMIGCLKAADCYQIQSCDNENHNRLIRDVGNLTRTTADNETYRTDWESELEFRVLPKNLFQPQTDNPSGFNPLILACLIVIAICLLCTVFVVIIKSSSKH